MDPVKETPIYFAVRVQGVMLGRHEVELVAVKHAVEILSAQVMELTGQLQSLRSTLSSPQPRYLPEPRINNPPCYSGQPTECRAFLTQCEVIFSLQPTTYAEDRSRVAFVLSLLTGRARDWGAAVWRSEAGCCELFSTFKEEIKIFDRSVYGHEASRQLVTLRQGRRSATDYAIEFRTLAATCEWNEQALSARFLEGLSGDIKEEIFFRDQPTGLDQLVELAIRLDKRFEARRHARYSTPEPRTVPPIVSPPAVVSPVPDPMELGGSSHLHC